MDGAFRPQAGCQVWASVAALGVSQIRPVRTSSDGTYLLESVPASGTSATRVDLIVNPFGSEFLDPGSANHSRGVVEVRAGMVAIAADLVLESLPYVVVRVRDQEGHVVSEAHARESLLRGRGAHANDEGLIRLHFPAGEEGRPRSVAIEADGFAPCIIESATPDVRSPPEIAVVLHPASELKGRVVWSNGAPAEDIHVVVADGRVPATIAFADGQTHVPRNDAWGAFRPWYAYLSTRSDGDGNFCLRNLPDGPFHLLAVDD